MPALVERRQIAHLAGLLLLGLLVAGHRGGRLLGLGGRGGDRQRRRRRETRGRKPALSAEQAASIEQAFCSQAARPRTFCSV